MNLQQEPLQILAFGAKQGNGVVASGAQALQKRDAPARVQGCREDHFLEQIEVHVAGTREGHEIPARFDETQRIEIDVLVAAGGPIDLSPTSREYGRIANDKAETGAGRRQAANMLKGVRDHERGAVARSITLVILTCTIDGRRGYVDLFHRNGSSRRRVHSEPTGIREQVQHAAS